MRKRPARASIARLIVLVVGAQCFAMTAVRAADAPVFPSSTWEGRTPVSLQLDEHRLAAVAQALGGRGCVVVDGYLVQSWGDQAVKSDWYSSAKPVLSTLLMFAVQEGLVASPDARIADFGWQLSPKDQPMTFRHLGAMTSGYARPEPPGAAWAYNDFAIQLYQLTLFDRVFRAEPDAVAAAPERLGSLGFEDGLTFRPNRRLWATPRDFARLGWLWLNRGRWGDKQLLRADLVDDLLRPQVDASLPNTQPATTDDYLGIGSYGGDSDHFSQAGPGIYGFNFWFNGFGPRHPEVRTWPDAPPDAFMTLGFGGNCLLVLPSQKAVVACAAGDWGRNTPGDSASVFNNRLKLIVAAVTPSAAPATPPVVPAPAPLAAPRIAGELRQWHTVELLIPGPSTSEDATFNPFTDVRLDVELAQGDVRYTVPGHFAADGAAAETGAAAGNVWRAYFTPDRTGAWNWRATFRQGNEAAIATDPVSSAELPEFASAGEFEIAATDKAAPDLRADGHLRYVGSRYPRFAGSGRWFLKSGADSPENALAFVDFDATPASHRFGPHEFDAAPDDRTWRGSGGRNLMGALNYLSAKGVNSIYLLTMNVRGDGDDVWPWTSHDERQRFDVSKLDQWERVFAHAERRGIALHLVLQEQENDQLLDRGALGPTRRLYLRELVSRFGHHLAIVWNLGEENTNTTDERLAMAEHLRMLDPYGHPIVLHTFPKQQDKVYAPLLGSPWFDGVSLQTNDTRAQTRTWIERSAAAGRPWIVSLDEIGPADTGVVPDAVDYHHAEVRREHLWPHFMSGGAGVEWLFGYKYPHHDVNLEDFRSRDHLWDISRWAVDFVTLHFPVADSQPADDLTPASDDFCLALPDRAYAIFALQAETVQLKLPAGEYSVDWFDPRRGGRLRAGSVTKVVGPGLVDLGQPPRDPHDDWACLVRRIDVATRPTP